MGLTPFRACLKFKSASMRNSGIERVSGCWNTDVGIPVSVEVFISKDSSEGGIPASI